MVDLAQHYRHSVLRERIIEHDFVGNALRRLWQLGVTDVHVLRSEFDADGYDIVMSRGRILRHIQFKSVLDVGKTSHTKISLKLSDQPSGCVVWIVVTSGLDPVSYLWFGGRPGEPLPEIRDMKVAKHTKGNAEGVKVPRPDHRTVLRSRFEALPSLDDVLRRLFGDGVIDRA